MDEQNPNTPPSTSPVAPVPGTPQFMDVVTPDNPHPATTESQPASAPAAVESTPSESPTPIIPPAPEVVAGLVPPQPTAEPTPEPSVAPTVVTSEPAPASETAVHSSASHHAAGKHGAPVAAIVIAVVVGVAFAGLVIYGYLRSKDSGAIKRSDTSQTQKQTASANDVDTANEEIDKNLQQAKDDTDFASSNLSDATLGL